jgi:hypothetical protein
MPRVARQGAAQHVHLQPRRGHAAAAAMGQRHDAVDVGELRKQRLDPGRDHAAGGRRAVHRGDDADVVARGGAAVGAAIALEGGGRGDVLGRVRIGAEGIVALEIAHDAIVRMDVRARVQVIGGKADDLVVLAQRLALLDRPGEDLVARRHTRRRGDVGLDRRAGKDVHARHDDVVGGMQPDGERCGHGVLAF